MSNAIELQPFDSLKYPCKAMKRSKGVYPGTVAVRTLATLSKAARICSRILRARSIRARIFAHLGAFDVAKFIHATKNHFLLDADEKQHFLNPLRDIFTDNELKYIREMIKNGDIIAIWGYELRRLFDRVHRVTSYASEEDSRTKTHLWMGGGSLIPVTLPGNWATPTVKNNVRYPLQLKANTPDPLLLIGQVDWQFVCCDIKGNIELGVKVDLADLLDESMTGIVRPRRVKPMNVSYINLSRGEMQLKSCEFSDRRNVAFDTGVNLRLSLYDSAIDHGEEIFGSYKLRLGSRG
jgi:hypothetical protein